MSYIYRIPDRVWLMALLCVAVVLGAYAANLNFKVKRLESQVDLYVNQTARLMDDVSTLARSTVVGNITAVFQDNNTVIYVHGDDVTYLSGLGYVCNLTNILVRPVDVWIFFKLTYTTTGAGTVTYSYTPQQIVTVQSPELDAVPFIWGAYPIQLTGFEPGDVIEWTLEITVVAKYGAVDLTSTKIIIIYCMEVI